MKYLALIFLGIPLVWARAHPGARIITGEPASPGQFPFAAAVYVTTSSGNYFCTGSLIRLNWVLTAAQCINKATSWTVIVGGTKLTGADPNRITIASTEGFMHQQFNASTLWEDVGFVKLRETLVESQFIRPIDWVNGSREIEYYEAGIPVVGMGWGQISDSSDVLSNDLLYSEMEMTHIEECRVFYGNQVTGYMTCAHGFWNTGTCYGDIGGPLITKNVDRGDWLQIGIASFTSQRGCESLDPSGYTRVDWYDFWIKLITTHM